jgi:hypothetical protein
MKSPTMPEIKAPPEFRELVGAFFPESLELVEEDNYDPSQDPDRLELRKRWIAFTLSRLSDQKKRIFKECLTHLLAQNPSEEQLQELWNSSGSHYFMTGKHGYEAMRVFLTMIRDQIA